MRGRARRARLDRGARPPGSLWGQPLDPSDSLTELGACHALLGDRTRTAILRAGGVRSPVTGPLPYTVTGADIVELAGLLRPRTAIPLHSEG